MAKAYHQVNVSRYKSKKNGWYQDQITFANAGYYHLRLNQLDPTIFPIPNYSLSPRCRISGTIFNSKVQKYRSCIYRYLKSPT
jgi:hypothetical protein